MNNNLHIVTVATHSQYYFPYLIESCEKMGSKLVILGYGKKWKGFSWKFKLVIDYLNNLDKNNIVCFVDGYDVICTRNLKELSTNFLKLKKKNNCKIIISEHKLIKNNYLLDINETILNFSFGKCKNKFLNSGIYIGQVKDLLEILNKVYIDDIDTMDDQLLLTKYCQTYPDDIYIDTNNELFLSLELPYKEIDSYLEFDNNKVSYNNNYPFFIHGPGQTYLDNIIIKMNYNYTDKINNKIFSEIPNRFFFYIKNNKIIYIILFILILSVGVGAYFYKKNKKIRKVKF